VSLTRRELVGGAAVAAVVAPAPAVMGQPPSTAGIQKDEQIAPMERGSASLQREFQLPEPILFGPTRSRSGELETI
jgi:hypothetical protein